MFMSSFNLIIPDLRPHAAGSGQTAVEMLDSIDKHLLSCVNWPAFPYQPEVYFRIGHSGDHLYLKFLVREESIRALETTINGEVYKDSCVEFFVSFDGIHYYNFEFNCIGTPHVAYGESRHNRQQLPVALIRTISIHASLGNRAFDTMSGGFAWELLTIIPAGCFMYTPGHDLKGSHARANFYKCGDELPVPHFVTWNPVRTPEPDYHRPECFGTVRFG